MKTKIGAIFAVALMLVGGFCMAFATPELNFSAPALREVSKADWNGSIFEELLNTTFDLAETTGYIGDILMANIGNFVSLGIALMLAGVAGAIAVIGIVMIMNGVNKVNKGRRN